jgi:hypothetical protein
MTEDAEDGSVTASRGSFAQSERCCALYKRESVVYVL